MMLKQSLEHKVRQCSEFCKCLNMSEVLTENVLTYAREKMPGGFADIAGTTACPRGRNHPAFFHART